jgi:hypothetical protein
MQGLLGGTCRQKFRERGVGASSAGASLVWALSGTAQGHLPITAQPASTVCTVTLLVAERIVGNPEVVHMSELCLRFLVPPPRDVKPTRTALVIPRRYGAHRQRSIKSNTAPRSSKAPPGTIPRTYSLSADSTPAGNSRLPQPPALKPVTSLSNSATHAASIPPSRTAPRFLNVQSPSEPMTRHSA